MCIVFLAYSLHERMRSFLSMFYYMAALCFSYALLFIHSGHFYSASSSPLLLRSAPGTARIAYFARVSRRSATGNCELRTCPRPGLHGGQSGIRTYDPLVERLRLYQCATTSHVLLNKFNLKNRLQRNDGDYNASRNQVHK